MSTTTVTVERDTLHRLASILGAAILAADKAADHSAAGQDVEGEIADIRILLEDLVVKVHMAMT